MKRLILLILLAAPCWGYGADGSDVALKTSNLPAYAQVSLQSYLTWTWQDGITCWYGSTFSVTVKLMDGNIHQVTFYTVDDDSTARAETILSSSGQSQLIANFHTGYYMSFTFSGTQTFTFTRYAGANAVLTGIYFDSPAAPKHSVSLGWVASTSPGVTGYNLYRNGVLLAALGNVTTFVDTTVVGGGVYMYTLSAVSPVGESVQIPAGYLVPSP